MIEEMAKETKMLDTGHEIESIITSGLTIYGDRARIKQALRIFADNALKFTPADGTVTFRLNEEDGYAVVVVEDTGIGIPERICHAFLIASTGWMLQGSATWEGMGLGFQ